MELMCSIFCLSTACPTRHMTKVGNSSSQQALYSEKPHKCSFISIIKRPVSSGIWGKHTQSCSVMKSWLWPKSKVLNLRSDGLKLKAFYQSGGIETCRILSDAYDEREHYMLISMGCAEEGEVEGWTEGPQMK